MNAEASAIEHDLRRPIFTAFHGSVSIAVAVFAIASSFVSTMAGTFATSLLSRDRRSALPGSWSMFPCRPA